MKAMRRRKDRASGSADLHPGSYSLLALPVELLHQVLGMLGPEELAELLQTSKAMAQEVMQCSAQRLTLVVELHRGLGFAAIRQLLQWSPPSSLKVMLNGCRGYPSQYSTRDWDELSNLFSVPCTTSPAPSMQQGQHMQLPCIAEVCIQDFTLGSIVPAGLAATCPSLHTLQLINCTVYESSNSNTVSSAVASAWPAQHLHTLTLTGLKLPQGNTSHRYSLPPAATYINQLRSMAPNLRCLKLMDTSFLKHVVALGPQLQTLHIRQLRQLPPALATHLQQLQQLVLPDTRVSSTADMQQLLSLPNLTHLEVESVSHDVSGDYSSHTCKWQYLHLHLHDEGLSLSNLAKLPLHSLTHPLKLGGRNDCVRLLLPSPGSDRFPCLQRLAQQLTTCGVQVLVPRVAWALEYSYALVAGACLVPAFLAIGPAFGLQAHVAFYKTFVDQPIMEALATVYGPSLKQLEFEKCAFLSEAWHAALSGLPALRRIELHQGNYDGMAMMRNRDDEQEAKTAKVVRQLAAAMAQQPARRCIKVACSHNMRCVSLDSFVELVLGGSEEELAGVEVTAVRAKAGEVYVCGWESWLSITSKI